MQITLTIPDELASRLRPVEAELPRILELGVRAWAAEGEPGFSGLADVLEALASLPTPEEVLALRPSAGLRNGIEELVERSRAGELSSAEQRQWDQYQYLEYLVRFAKGRAALKLRAG